MGKKAGVFGAHSVQGHRRWGRPRQGLLGALEKKTWAWGMSPNLKFHTPAPPANLHRANARIERNVSWWTLGARPLLSKFLPFATVLRKSMARSLFDSQWTGFGGTCRSRKDVTYCAGSVFGDHRPFQSPKELAVHFSLLLVQPGATQFLCDLEMSNSGSTRKKEAYQLPLKSEQRKNFRSKERTTFISLYALSTQCFARFSVSPPFCARTFDE